MKIFSKEDIGSHIIYKIFSIKVKLRKISNNRMFVIDKRGIKKRVFWISGLQVKFYGENSEIIIHKPMIKFINSKIICGSNCNVEIKSSSNKANKLVIQANADNSTVLIGKNFRCTNYCDLISHREPDLKIEIGDNCMFGSNVIIRNTDAHTIIDKTTKEIINYGKSVHIKDHVWVGREVHILKGVEIASDSIIASNSLVSKSCLDENCIYGGVPAKKIKSNVEWEAASIRYYEKHMQK